MKKKFYSVITVVILLFIICGIVMILQNGRISVTTPENISFSEENPAEISMFLDIDAINGTVSKLSIDGLPRASLYIVSEKRKIYLAVNFSARFVPCYWGYNCPTPVIPKGLMANGNMVAEDALTGELVVISPVKDMDTVSKISEITADEAESKIVYQVVLD